MDMAFPAERTHFFQASIKPDEGSRPVPLVEQGSSVEPEAKVAKSRVFHQITTTVTETGTGQVIELSQDSPPPVGVRN